MDEGPTRALYPYSQLKNILSPQGCRQAVLDETTTFEQEFGRDVVQPFYDLLWRLNTVVDVFTSHGTVSPPNRESPFDWAKAFVGSAVILLPRNQHLRHQLPDADGRAGMLTRLLAESKFIPTDPRETMGWQVLIYPTTMTLLYDVVLTNDDRSFVLPQAPEERLGFGHEIVISGSAGTRDRAAERWSNAIRFVLDTMTPLPSGPPFDHFVTAQAARDAVLGDQS
jgi:hypothetical protein